MEIERKPNNLGARKSGVEFFGGYAVPALRIREVTLFIVTGAGKNLYLYTPLTFLFFAL
jgi:hypothetical protein